MAPNDKHLFARDARDRMIDLLGFGETSPLRDLPVYRDGNGRMVVPDGERAEIPIDASQPDCVYHLWHRTDDVAVADGGAGASGDGTDEPTSEPGTGDTILLGSPPVVQDDSYRIRAVKTGSGRWAYLHHLADVRTGIDTTLRAWVRSGRLLDPMIDTPKDGDIRLVDHGAAIEVEVAGSQPGVMYRLVLADGATVVSQTDVRGDRGNIVLRTRPITEDTELRVLALRDFDASLGQAPQQSLLDAVLPVVVRANADLSVVLDPGAIIDYGGSASVTIENAEPGVAYRLYARPILDREFAYHGPANDLIEVAGELLPGGEVAATESTTESTDGTASTEEPARRMIYIQRPPHLAAWGEQADQASLTGLVPVGEAVTGAGVALRLPLGALTEDSLVVIQARKEHLTADGRRVVDATALRLVPVILVRPDPTPALDLQVLVQGTPDSAQTSGQIRVAGGQPGVYYHLRRDPAGPDLGRPAFFHKRDHDDPIENKGVRQLAIEVDFAIPRDPDNHLVTTEPRALGAAVLGTDLSVRRAASVVSLDPGARARTSPRSPIVATEPLPAGTTLYVHAAKALTGVSQPLPRTAGIPTPPALRVDDTTADGERTVNIVVTASVAGTSYQVMRHGIAMGEAQEGNGAALAFPVAPPVVDTVYHLLVARADADGIPVRQLIEVPVAGVPDAGDALGVSETAETAPDTQA